MEEDLLKPVNTSPLSDYDINKGVLFPAGGIWFNINAIRSCLARCCFVYIYISLDKVHKKELKGCIG